MFRGWGLPILAVIFTGFMVVHLLRSDRSLPDLEPAVTPARAPYAQVVAASGLIEPRSESISVGSEMQGVVVEVAVTEGQQVRAGDLLFRLDDRDLRAQLAVRQADLEAARSSLARVEGRPRPEEIPPSAAMVRKAEATLAGETDLYNRLERLNANSVASEQELIAARQAVAIAREALAHAQAQHELLLAGSWEQDKAVARAEVVRAERLVEHTKTDLARLEVQAPIEGDILKVSVRRGEYVGAAPEQALIMMGDLAQMHVRVTIDEQDLPRFRPGCAGQAYVRGDAEVPLDLTFVRVVPYAQPKQSLSRNAHEKVDTRVLEVLYALPAGVQGLFVGQQLDVFLSVEPSLSAPAQAGESDLPGPVLVDPNKAQARLAPR